MRVLIVLSMVLLAGCKDDLRPVSASWNTLNAQWQRELDVLKADEIEQLRKISGLCATEGLAPVNPAMKTCADLTVAAQTDTAGLEALALALSRHRTGVEQAIARGKRLEGEVAVEAAATELATMVARAQDNAQLRRDASRALATQVTQEFEAAKAATIASRARTQMWSQASTQKTAIELTDVHFTNGAPVPAQQPQLQELLAWANGCSALSFSITAHTEARAAAVKKFLVDNGVAPARIVGIKQLSGEEPDPEELEAALQRITIQPTTTCPSGERAELALP